MRLFFERLLARLFPPEPLGVLDETSQQYRDRLERANLPYRTFNEYVGRVVPGSTKEGPAPPPEPPRGTREARREMLNEAKFTPTEFRSVVE